MPISKSAKKALRVSRRKTSLNRYRKALIKDALKNVTAETASKAVSYIDKAVKWNLFHKNKASRLKARFSVLAPAGTKEKAKPTEKKATTKKATPKAKAPSKKTTKKS
jgi:ribosomal protein S20